MLLRPRQKKFVDRSLEALNSFGNALGVAPTGAGKTILFSEIVGRLVKSKNTKTIVIAHRDELTTQNQEKFLRVNPSIKTSVYNAKVKSWDGQVTFAMVQTLAQKANLETMPKPDLLVIDEAHHAAAETYKRILDHVQELNPECLILGLTATPNRSDGIGLRDVFSNVADQISLNELISAGHLVVPRTFVIDVGVTSQLSQIRETGQDFDMSAVDKIMNKRPINEAVVEQWIEKAEDRQTVVFCSTVAHAEAVSDAFTSAGIQTALVTGELNDTERHEQLEAYSSGKIRVIINVQVLTEGWDHPPTSCVVLLRPSSAKSTMIQMVGRGLRTVNIQEHPGIIKTDCLVLDFGTSSIIHGSLEQNINLDGSEPEDTYLLMTCPSCEAEIPLSSAECPICGHDFHRGSEQSEVENVSSVEMMEINLLNRSSFEWVDLFGDDFSFISSGFNAWGGVFYLDGVWYSVGGKAKETPRLLSIGERIVCLAAADDWLNENETEDTAHKTRKWLHELPTEKQIVLLPAKSKLDYNLTRYQASAHITFKINEKGIKNLITEASS
jgi:superfamily II DNA or RNA helicase